MDRFGTRWQEGAGKEFVDRLSREGRSGNRFSVLESPFGTTPDGRLDLRSLRLGERTELRRITFEPADFGAAQWDGVWLERSTFHGATFQRPSFQRMTDHGDVFAGCAFVKTSFRETYIGYKGSRFEGCTFEGGDFRRASFIRPEFDDCSFSDCKLTGCDFNGSSFERCQFAGALNDVWFRGGFAHPDHVDHFGQPRANRMVDVSFENASLRDLTLSDGCDLSTVRLPNDGRHMLVDHWLERLEGLLEQLEPRSDVERKAVSTFVFVRLAHARNQDWFILNRDDLDRDLEPARGRHSAANRQNQRAGDTAR